MSSSLRSAQPIKKRRLAPPPSGWKCPSCGQNQMSRVNKSCKLADGLVMPKLDRLQCQACGEDFFDLFAMDQIAAFRREAKTLSPKRVLQKTMAA